MSVFALMTLLSCGVGDATYLAFTASLSPLDGSGVNGEVTIFVTARAGVSGLLGVGSATGLEADLKGLRNGGTCGNVTNGCGVHVHSGTACTDTATQGGHYFAGATDPWANLRYEATDANGVGKFRFDATTTATSLVNKPFIVHNSAGGRVACGLLSQVTGLTSATLAPINGAAAAGEVTIRTTSTGIIGAGYATGLEANLKDAGQGGTDCTAANGCGVHIHSGTACTNAATQGGHYFDGTVDPWAAVRYDLTSATGGGDFVFEVKNAATAVINKPFIVHNNAGGRVACGILLDTIATTGTTTLTPWDSSASSDSGTSLDSLYSSSFKEDSSAASIQKSSSGSVSGSTASGSYGSYMQIWQWLLFLGLCCICGVAGSLGMMGKKKPKKVKKSKAVPAPAPEPAPEPADFDLPPLMPLATTSVAIPSYSMMAPATTTMAYPGTMAYSAPVYGSYAGNPGTMAYSAPVYGGYAGNVI